MFSYEVNTSTLWHKHAGYPIKKKNIYSRQEWSSVDIIRKCSLKKPFSHCWSTCRQKVATKRLQRINSTKLPKKEEMT